MDAKALLENAQSSGVDLFLDQGRVNYRGPKAVLTPHFIAELRLNKAALAALLATGPTPRIRRLTEEGLSLARLQVEKCFLCKWIVEAASAEGHLKATSFDYVGNCRFPVRSQIKHLELELLSDRNRRDEDLQRDQ